MRDDLGLEFVRMVNEPARVAEPSRRVEGRQQAEYYRRGEPIRREMPRRSKSKARVSVGRVLKGAFKTAIVIGLAVWFAGVLWDNMGLKEAVSRLFEKDAVAVKGNGLPHPEWTEDYLTVNPYSRPGTTLTEVKDIFVHYTANPGTNAVQNRSYFEQLGRTRERGASSHFIIGYEGDILLCVPLDEVAYAVKTRNYDSMSIECCYLNEDGSFTQETYDALVELLVWLLKEYDLTTENILRHYDCGGKKCPLYYVEHEDEWLQLKRDVEQKFCE